MNLELITEFPLADFQDILLVSATTPIMADPGGFKRLSNIVETASLLVVKQNWWVAKVSNIAQICKLNWEVVSIVQFSSVQTMLLAEMSSATVASIVPSKLNEWRKEAPICNIFLPLESQWSFDFDIFSGTNVTSVISSVQFIASKTLRIFRH